MAFKKLFALGMTLAVAGVATSARADCTLPDAPGGTIEYFDATTVFKYCDGTNWIAWGESASGLWQENGSDIYFNSGNVGIGTDDPSTTLDLYADGSVLPSFTVRDGDIAIPNYSAMGINPPLTSDTIGRMTAMASASGGVNFRGFTNSTPNAYPLSFVGVHGSTSPTNAAVIFGAQKHNGSTSTTNLSDSEKAISFMNGSVVGTELMTILGGGNVGIGTDSPDSLLTVSGAQSGDNIFNIKANGSNVFTVKGNGNVEIAGAQGDLTVKRNVLMSSTGFAGNANAHTKWSSGTIYHNSQTDQYITFGANYASSSLIFATGAFDGAGTELMRLTETGNVGIGTTTPSSGTGGQLKLDVEGPVGATNYCDEDGNNCFTAATAGGLWNAGSGDVIYYNSGTPKVGIGTDNPVDGLHIYKSSALDTPAAGIVLSRYQASTTDMRSAGIFNYFDSTAATEVLAFGLSQSTTPNTLSNAKMVVRSDGNVGIGTRSPSLAKLQIYTSSPADGVHAFMSRADGSNVDGQKDVAGFFHNLVGVPDNNDTALIASVANASGNIRILDLQNNDTSSYGTGNSVFTVFGDGQIGVGDITPDGTLKIDVEGNIGATNYCDEDGNNCFTAALVSGGSSLWTASAGDAIYFNSGTPLVGIGTNSPSETLQIHVSGRDNYKDAFSFNATTNDAILTMRSRSGEASISIGESSATPLIIGDLGNQFGIGRAGGIVAVNGTSFQPYSDGGTDLGSATRGWGDLYFDGTGTTIQQKEAIASNLNILLGNTRDDGASNQHAFTIRAPMDYANTSYFRVLGDTTTPFIIDGGGNVGIGTDSPAYTLDIEGSGISYSNPTFTGSLRITNASNNTIAFSNSGIGTFLTAGPSNVIDTGGQTIKSLIRGAIFSSTTGANALQTYEGDVILGSTSGNVGIGTTTPSSGTGGQLKLDVEGPVGATNYCDEDGNNCFTAASVSGGSSLWTASAGDAIYFNSGTPRVGIGTDSPSETLEVDGTFLITQNGQNALKVVGNGLSSTDPYATVIGTRQGGIGLIIRGAANTAHEGIAAQHVYSSGRIGFKSSIAINHSPGTNADVNFGRVDATTIGLYTTNTGTTLGQLNVGTIGINTTTPSSGTGGQLKLDVEGPIGATNYCDEDGNNCFTAASVGGGGALGDLIDAITDYDTDYNLFIGSGAGDDIANGGQYNFAVGEDALGALTTGDYNFALGHNALSTLTSNSYNTAIGYNALTANSTGTGNTGVGYSVLQSNTSGVSNSAYGQQSLQGNTEGGSNAALGYRTLYSNKAKSRNTAIGAEAMRYADDTTTPGDANNTAVGFQSLRGSTTASANTGGNNTALGTFALWLNTTGYQNTATGMQASVSNTVGNLNASYGAYALYSNKALSKNTAIGHSAMYYANDTTSAGDGNNVAVGYEALRGSTTASANTGINNTAVGAFALQSNTSGGALTAVGLNALRYNTTGAHNSAFGLQALVSNIGGSNNTAIGSSVLYNNTTGNLNVGVGVNALYGNTAGMSNTVVGTNALYTNKAKSKSTAVGYEALRYADDTTSAEDANNVAVGYQALRGSTTAANNTGANNTAVGTSALFATTSGNNNVAVGERSLTNNSTGQSNAAVGFVSLFDNTVGQQNTAHGAYALFSNKAKSKSTAVGYEALRYADDTTSAGDGNNVAVGYQALRGSTTASENTGVRNTAIGAQSLYSNTSGSDNTANGHQALLANTTGFMNTANGMQALYDNSTGNNNVATGYRSLFNNTTGASNTSIGSLTLSANISGHSNVAVGTAALGLNTASENIGIGHQALRYNSSGSKNVAIGYNAGVGVSGSTVASNNVFIGYHAGNSVTTGTDNIIIGFDEDLSDPTASNELNIGGVLFGDLNTAGDPKIGAAKYCDENLANCFVATDVGGGGGSSLWEVDSNVVRALSGTVDYATDDFVFGSPQLDGDGNTDHNNRMFFDKSKGAFRAGGVSGAGWDAASIGTNSFATGLNNYAIGGFSFASGWSNNAIGQSASVLGWASYASGRASLAAGREARTYGNETIALGYDLRAYGYSSTVMGSQVWTGSGSARTSHTEGSGYGNHTYAVGLQSAAQATDPKVTGDRSAVFFFDGNTADANSGYDFDESDKFALIGGEFQIDDQSSTANKGCIKYNSATTKLQFSHDCSSYSDFGSGGGGGSSLWTAGSGDTIYYNSGTAKVAINRVAANEALDVGGNILARGKLGINAIGSFDLTVRAGGSQPVIEMQESDGTPSAQWGSKIGSGDLFFDAEKAGAGIGFRTSGNTERLFINSSGNVGIGDNTPDTGLKLDVEGKIGASEYCDQNGANCTAAASLGGGGGGGASALNDLSDAKTIVNNIYLGGGAGLESVTGADNNTSVGASALKDNETGDNNTAIGSQSLLANTSADNTGVGYSALRFNTTGFHNTGIGASILQFNSTGKYNSAMGRYAARFNTTGSYNTAIGVNALYENRANSTSVAIGNNAIKNADSTTTENFTYNVAVGFQALQGSGSAANNTGIQNSVLGANTLLNNTSGSNNVAIGYQAGDLNTTGSDNILIGNGVDAPTATTSNHLNIGGVLFGDLANNEIGINNNDPAYTLDVDGDINYSGSLTNVSDRRLKDNIAPLNDRGAMIDKLAAIDTYTYTMKADEKGETRFGVMAQELEEIFPELVHTQDDGYKSVRYMELIPPMIEATKELKTENETLRAELNAMQSDIAALKRHTGFGISHAALGLLSLLMVMLGGGMVMVWNRRKA